MTNDVVDVVAGLSTGIGDAAIGFVNVFNPLWYVGLGFPNASEMQAYFHGSEIAAYNTSGYSYAIGQIAYTGVAAYALAPVFVKGFGYTLGFAGPVIATTAFGALGTHGTVNSAIGLYDTYQNWDHLNGAQLLGAIGTPLAGLIGGYAGFRATPQSVMNNAVLAGSLDRFRVFGYRSYSPKSILNPEPVSYVISPPNKWIGSKLSAQATQAAVDSLARRISSLRAGGVEAIEQVVLVGSRKTGWSATKNRPPLSTSDVDIAVNDWPWLKGSRYELKVVQKMQKIAGEFEELTGLKVQLHHRSLYSKQQWAEYFGEYFN